jgi:hypothetical protein
MRNVVTFAIIAAAAAGSAGCVNAHGEPGPTISRAYPVGPFQRIEVSGPYQVSVATGQAPSVNATGNQRLIERMVVEIEDGTLKIHPEKRHGIHMGWSNDGKAKVTVTTQMLDAAGIAGSGALAIDRIAGESFDGSVAGSGNLRVGNVDVQNLKMSIGGSGSIEASGRARGANYAIGGSGDIRAAKLATETAEVSIGGSGNIAGNASRTAKVDIAGSGNVTITGGAQCAVSKAGSGNVRCS